MQQVLTDPLGDAEKKPSDWLPEDLKESNVEVFIKPSSRMNARQRLAIYQRGYLARLRACMAAQFKALEYALGADLFQQFADLYIQKHPSTSYNLIDLGEKFAEFLEDTRPDKNEPEKESWIDFMIELIDFEYHINLIFDEKISETFLPAVESEPDENLKLNPHLRLFEHEYPILWFYNEFVHHKEPELPFPNPNFCAVLRFNLRLGLYPLRPEQFRFLQFFKTEKSIQKAKKKIDCRIEN